MALISHGKIKVWLVYNSKLMFGIYWMDLIPVTKHLKTKWANSWDFGTFNPPYSSNAHAQLFSGARCLMFGRTLRLLPYFVCANSEGSGETVRAVSPESSLVAYVISTIISWAGSNKDKVEKWVRIVAQASWVTCKTFFHNWRSSPFHSSSKASK